MHKAGIEIDRKKIEDRKEERIGIEMDQVGKEEFPKLI